MQGKVLKSRLISDSRPFIFESAVNEFLLDHSESKVTYSTATCTEDGQTYCLFTAFILYYEVA